MPFPSMNARPFCFVTALLLAAPGCGTDPEPASTTDSAAATATDSSASTADSSASTDTANPADTTARGTTAADAGSAPADTGPPPTPAYNTMTIAELVAALKSKDFDFINVHVPWSGQIPGTDAHIKYTLTDALEKRLGYNKGKKAILYCKTGPMSRVSAKALMKRGYWNIWDVPAGMIGWSAAGHKLDWTKP